MNLWKLFVLAFVVFFVAGVAFGAGGMNPDYRSLNSNVDLGDLRYSMGTSEQGEGRYYLSLNLNTSVGVINQSSISMYRDRFDPLRGTANAYIYGLLDVEPTEVPYVSQQNSVSRRGGLNFGNYASIGSFRQQEWNGKGWVPGDVFSTADVSLTLSHIDRVTYAYSNYREYDAYDYSWTDNWSGKTYTEHVPARFTADATWNLVFDNPSAAGMAFAMQPMSVSVNPVPEPSTWAMLVAAASGGLVLLRRRLIGC
jgi:hypothetical protein